MTLAHNYGAAFSFLSDAGGWQRWFFTALASVVSGVLTAAGVAGREDRLEGGLAVGVCRLHPAAIVLAGHTAAIHRIQPGGVAVPGVERIAGQRRAVAVDVDQGEFNGRRHAGGDHSEDLASASVIWAC